MRKRTLWLSSLTMVVASLIAILSLVGRGYPIALHRSRSEMPTYRGMTMTVVPERPGSRFRQGAVGFSIEAAELATRDLSSYQAPVALMRVLGPGVLRVGGNTADHAWWTSDSEPPPAWATSVITPADLVGLRELLKVTHWRTILGVNLAHFDPARAADEALFAHRILGSELLGVSIGNEPNGYGIPSIALRGAAYSPSAYLSEVAEYSAAIHAASPTIRLYGPEVGAPTIWLTTIGSEPRTPFSVLTAHYYPTSYSTARGRCKATPLPTPLDLLSPQVRQEESLLAEMLVAAGKHARRPTLISETNTTASCDASGAPETGPVFASALWSLDWILRASSAGVTGLNFHGSFGVCTPTSFSPVCAPGDITSGHVHVGAAPEYYGLLAARQLEGGRFVPVDIRAQNSEYLTAYATVHPHGVITLAIDNLATTSVGPFLLRVAGYHQATSESLNAPSVGATNGITFGNAAIDPEGTLRPSATKVPTVRGGFSVKLAPASAIVLTIYR